jgi:hypothetical protein
MESKKDLESKSDTTHTSILKRRILWEKTFGFAKAGIEQKAMVAGACGSSCCKRLISMGTRLARRGHQTLHEHNGTSV